MKIARHKMANVNCKNDNLIIDRFSSLDVFTQKDIIDEIKKIMKTKLNAFSLLSVFILLLCFVLNIFAFKNNLFVNLLVCIISLIISIFLSTSIINIEKSKKATVFELSINNKNISKKSYYISKKNIMFDFNLINKITL